MDANRHRKLIVCEWITLDGVMQAPGLKDEDPEGGFQHGGWQTPYFDDIFGKVVTETIASSDALLLGRRTYDIFSAYWPTSDEQPIADSLNSMTKYVASTTRDKLDWQNSILLKGDVVPEIGKLKQQTGKNILLFGSGKLVQTLMRHNLVDEYLLAVHPLVLGSGKRFSPGFADKTTFRLLDSKTTTKGVLLLSYAPAAS